MIFSCTNKIITKIKSVKPVTADKVELGFHNWYVDLIYLERKAYFLYTNSQSLFSFIIYMGSKKERKEMDLLFRKSLQEMIVREMGFNQSHLDLIDLIC